jgi:hypothetical protein
MRNNLFVVSAAAFALFGAPAAAQADPAIHFKVNEQIPFAGFEVAVPCTGDLITFTQGSLHDAFFLTINGSHFSVTTHDQPDGLKGTDTSGRRYEGVGITEEHDSGSFVTGQAETTMVNNFNMVGKAGAPTFKTHETFHVTITPSGRLTAFHDSLRITCG